MILAVALGVTLQMSEIQREEALAALQCRWDAQVSGMRTPQQHDSWTHRTALDETLREYLGVAVEFLDVAEREGLVEVHKQEALLNGSDLLRHFPQLKGTNKIGALLQEAWQYSILHPGTDRSEVLAHISETLTSMP